MVLLRIEPDLNAVHDLLPVNELASRLEGISARTNPSTVFVDPEGRVAARVLGITDAREIAALAASVTGPA